MANSIYQRQNQLEILKCLVVQRRLYSFVKYWQVVPACVMVASIVVPLCFEKSSDGCGVGDWVSAGISVSVWGSAWLLGKFRDSFIKTAAGFQQYVDYKLFSREMGRSFNWKGMPLPSEIARRVSKVTQEDVEREKVRDWYSDYSTFSGQYAVLCCQKENVRWDRSLRILLLVVLSVILFGWIAWAIVEVFDVIKMKRFISFLLATVMLITSVCISFFAYAVEDLSQGYSLQVYYYNDKKEFVEVTEQLSVMEQEDIQLYACLVYEDGTVWDITTSGMPSDLDGYTLDWHSDARYLAFSEENDGKIHGYDATKGEIKLFGRNVKEYTKKQLTDIVNETMLNDESSSKGIQVYIGEESPVNNMKDCSVVTATYELGDGLHGTIGIVGPKRMDYDKVVSTLKSMTTQLDEIFKKKE